MKTKGTIILSIAALLFAAFATPVYAASAVASGSPALSSTSVSTSSYSPQPGDVKLTRDKVFLDLSRSRLIVSTGSPTRVDAVLSGNLPDPCHVLRIVVGSTIASSSINISVYSLFDPAVACATVLQPFSVKVPLGSFTSGSYTVTVNGLLLGKFSVGSTTTTASPLAISSSGTSASTLSLSPSPSASLLSTGSSLATSTSISSTGYSPQPGDALLTRDKVFLDLAGSRLIVSTGSPTKVAAVLSGNLPDPCHVLRVVVGSSTTSSSINIQVYSLYKAGVACITVLKPFSVTVPLGSFTSGSYSVLVNGMLLGRFSANSTTVNSVTQ
jgi:hypothetical protein